MKNNNEQENYYKVKLENPKNNSAQVVGWKNNLAQRVRFEQISKIIEKDKNFTINDLGCGIGDFANYLETTGYKLSSYYGYDVYGKMIEIAKKKYSNKNLYFNKIADSDEMKIADYTVASGIFNLKHSKSEPEWLTYILNEIEKMNHKSRKGFSFNMLTKYSDSEHMRSELYYADPCFIFDFCKRNLSKNVALFHDYYEYDFTILVKKDIH